MIATAKNANTPPEAPVSLAQLKPGTTATLTHTSLDDNDAQLLRAMGLRPNATLRVCRTGQPCIVELPDHCGPGCRIALAKDLAKKLHVNHAN